MVRGERRWAKKVSVYIHCGFPYPVNSSSFRDMSRLAYMPAVVWPGTHLMVQVDGFVLEVFIYVATVAGDACVRCPAVYVSAKGVGGVGEQVHR